LNFLGGEEGVLLDFSRSFGGFERFCKDSLNYIKGKVNICDFIG